MENELQQTLDNILQDKNTNLKPENLKQGVTCLGVEGTMQSGLDTSDANATANDITANKTAYVNGEKITGTLPLFPNSRTFTVDGGITNDTENSKLTISTINTLKQILDSNLNMEFSTSYSNAAEAIGLAPDKIKKDETILGVTGTLDAQGIQIADYFNTTPQEGQRILKAYPTTIDCSNLTNFSFFAEFENIVHVFFCFLSLCF